MRAPSRVMSRVWASWLKGLPSLPIPYTRTGNAITNRLSIRSGIGNSHNSKTISWRLLPLCACSRWCQLLNEYLQRWPTLSRQPLLCFVPHPCRSAFVLERQGGNDTDRIAKSALADDTYLAQHVSAGTDY